MFTLPHVIDHLIIRQNRRLFPTANLMKIKRSCRAAYNESEEEQVMKIGLLLLTGLITVGVLLIVLGGPLNTGTPTSTPLPADTRDQQALARQLADQIGPAPADYDAACAVDRITSASADYNRRVLAAVTAFLQQYGSAFKPHALQSIIRSGIAQTNPPPYRLGTTRVYGKTSDAILVYIGYINCPIGSHYSTSMGGLYVFSSSGQRWHLNDGHSVDAYPTANGWIALADLSPSSISGDYHAEFWQIMPTNGEWGIRTITSFQFPQPSLMDYRVDQQHLSMRVHNGMLPAP
ncbi:MAG TPA: hypothetical protein VHP83_07045, partial [Aggregatilineaceae bacterium]|nr:hypothetical protein [Aggregatilineaceae bacterium]